MMTSVIQETSSSRVLNKLFSIAIQKQVNERLGGVLRGMKDGVADELSDEEKIIAAQIILDEIEKSFQDWLKTARARLAKRT